MDTLMTCGCTANGYRVHADESQVPCCVVHGCDEVAEVQPDLSGRVATCLSCDRDRESKFTLAFFAYRPHAEKDLFYCGCRGWD